MLLASELIKGYVRKYLSTRYMMKFDLRTAYDSVDLEFIREMTKELGFPRVYSIRVWLSSTLCPK